MKGKALAKNLLLSSSLALLCALVVGQAALPDGLASKRRARLAASARDLVGRKTIVARGRKFSSDCSGTVMAACWGAGLDLAGLAAKAKGSSGVERIHDLLARAGLVLPACARPAVGDIVFWDDTYDRNGNGKADDPLSHAGIVVSAGKGGQFSYVHFRYDTGVIEERMNLDSPAVKVGADGGRLNSNMRIRTWRPDPRYLSGELYRESGCAVSLRAGWEAGS